MTAFVPITAARSIALLEAADMTDVRRLLAGYAAAGLIRSYALVIATSEVNGAKPPVRGPTIAVDLWQRILREAP